MEARRWSRRLFLSLAAVILGVCGLALLAQPAMAVSTNDYGRDLAVDASGNVYVTGPAKALNQNQVGVVSQFLTMKYNASGVKQWTRYYGPSISPGDIEGYEPYALALDNQGNVFVAGIYASLFSARIVLIKYNSAGTRLWAWSAQRYVLATVALAVDPGGNAYVTAFVRYSDLQNPGIQTLKFSPGGTVLWHSLYQGAISYRADLPRAIVVNSGYLYVAGTTKNKSGKFQPVIFRYNPGTGGLIWSLILPSVTQPLDGKFSPGKPLAVSSTGTVHYTFPHLNAAGKYCWATVKYLYNQTNPWGSGAIKLFGGNWGNDIPRSLALDPSGNIYVTGNLVGYHMLYNSFWAVKYSAAGAYSWGINGGSAIQRTTTPSSLAVDPVSRKVYITGKDQGATDTKMVALAIAADGKSIAWKKSWSNSNFNTNNQGMALALGPSNLSVYVVGYGYNAGLTKSFDFLTLKYTSGGTLSWVNSQ